MEIDVLQIKPRDQQPESAKEFTNKVLKYLVEVCEVLEIGPMTIPVEPLTAQLMHAAYLDERAFKHYSVYIGLDAQRKCQAMFIGESVLDIMHKETVVWNSFYLARNEVKEDFDNRIKKDLLSKGYGTIVWRGRESI